MKRIITLGCFMALAWLLAWGSLNSEALDHTQPAIGTQQIARNTGQEQNTAPENLSPEIPASLVSGLNEVTTGEGGLEEHVSSALMGVGKNLVLENTRGAKEILVYKKAAPAVLFVVAGKKAFGSGVVIDTKGNVITNWHVVKNLPKVVVVFKPKNTAELKKELAFTARVRKVDKRRDLALLKINAPPKNLAFMRLGNSSNLTVGQDVHAIGHPEGANWTYTKGLVSQIRPAYKWTSNKKTSHRATVVQTQTPVSPGSSGGPLFDDKGNLIGINSFQAQGQGLNFAVAVNEVKAFLSSKKKKKPKPRQPNPKPRCTVSYDTTGQGWKNIQGCYFKVTSGQPDLWLVYRNPKKAAYAALDSKGRGVIDTIILTGKQTGKNIWYYFDTDCDGIVDMIGHQYVGKKEIDNYRKPSQEIAISSLAKELDAAIKKRKIPYPELRVCQ